MLAYIVRRVCQIIPLFFTLTVIIFVFIQLPPGDYLTMYIQELEMSGSDVSQAEVDRLTRLYYLDKPVVQQYLLWMRGILLRGDFGWSLQWQQPVMEVIGERLVLTSMVSLLTLMITWVIAIPVGIYSATHQYSLADYVFTFLGFIGISVPGFLIALVIMYGVFIRTGTSISGLFSQKYIGAAWSWPRFIDLLKHLWLPTALLGLAGTAAMIRTMRGMLLDELGKQYVTTARAKGVSERKLLFKYPVRIAINPMISTIGWILPGIISGEALVSIVLNMPTTGPILLRALMAQDMYLAGSFLLLTSSLTLVGTLISDILLAVLDPRIRFGAVSET